MKSTVSIKLRTAKSSSIWNFDFQSGILAGDCNAANITNCFVQDSSLNIDSGYMRPMYVGSFIAVANNSNISNRYTRDCVFNISANDKCHVPDYFIGQAGNGTVITNCFTNAKTITGTDLFEGAGYNFQGFTFIYVCNRCQSTRNM